MNNLFPVHITSRESAFSPKALWMVFWATFVHSVIAFMLTFGSALGVLLAMKLV